ncbi:MAG: hypothetical protein KC502_16715, partial [Myxococcales bacterium]|nr:hypothetical protein [Myxococcales bacterium]
MRSAKTQHRIAGFSVTLTLVVSLIAGNALAERKIPVRTAKAGRFNKSGKRKVKAGGGSVGVFKRNKRKRRLDPSYDPAAIKPGAGRTT